MWSVVLLVLDLLIILLTNIYCWIADQLWHPNFYKLSYHAFITTTIKTTPYNTFHVAIVSIKTHYILGTHLLLTFHVAINTWILVRSIFRHHWGPTAYRTQMDLTNWLPSIHGHTHKHTYRRQKQASRLSSNFWWRRFSSIAYYISLTERIKAGSHYAINDRGPIKLTVCPGWHTVRGLGGYK